MDTRTTARRLRPLASRRIEPRKLLASGYRFRYPKLEDALRHELKALK